jgi:hypothetical protein
MLYSEKISLNGETIMADSPIDPQDLHSQEGGHLPAVGEVITPQDAIDHDSTPAEEVELTAEQIGRGDGVVDAGQATGESQGPTPNQEAVDGSAIGRQDGIPAGVETHTTDTTTTDPA